MATIHESLCIFYLLAASIILTVLVWDSGPVRTLRQEFLHLLHTFQHLPRVIRQIVRLYSRGNKRYLNIYALVRNLIFVNPLLNGSLMSLTGV